MTQHEIDNKIVDVIYDNDQIYHVLEPNQEGVRGIPISQFLIRNTIATVRALLTDLDQDKIDWYVKELAYQESR